MGQIQRIQSVYLLLSAILMVVCACLPVGVFDPAGMGAQSVMYNLCVINEETGWNFRVCGLFVLLALSTVYSVTNIFGYNNRKRQSRNCLITMLLLLVWVLLYVVLGYVIGMPDAEFVYEFPAVLPVIALVLQWMARRGVLADEKLVRAADRIR